MKEFTTKIKNVIKKSFFFRVKEDMFSLKGATGIDSDDFSICMGKKKKKQIKPHPSYTGQSSTPSSETNVDTFLQHFFFPTWKRVKSETWHLNVSFFL